MTIDFCSGPFACAHCSCAPCILTKAGSCCMQRERMQGCGTTISCRVTLSTPTDSLHENRVCSQMRLTRRVSHPLGPASAPSRSITLGKEAPGALTAARAAAGVVLRGARRRACIHLGTAGRAGRRRGQWRFGARPVVVQPVLMSVGVVGVVHSRTVLQFLSLPIMRQAVTTAKNSRGKSQWPGCASFNKLERA